MLKKCVIYLVVLAVTVQGFILCVKANSVSISADSAVVMVAATGEVLYSKNEYKKRGIASTTKIMSCIVALENASLCDVATASIEDVTVEGTSMGLKAGDTVFVDALIKGMLLESGNDAANVTAAFVAGGKEQFSVLMNEKAKELGMKNTSFKNPSGLTEEGHYSCAYDMALLGSYAIKNFTFRSVCSLPKCTVKIGNPGYETTLYNHNKLLSRYDGALGIKTGFTKASGRCLVSAVERGGVTLVAVTLNAYDDWNDHVKLYDYCFPLVSSSKADISVESITLPVVNSDKKSVKLMLSRDIYVPYSEKVPQYTTTYFLPRFCYASIKKGDYVGWIELHTADGILIGKSYIVAGENAEAVNAEPQLSLIKKFLKYIEEDRR